jgi:hypothetical protein
VVQRILAETVPSPRVNAESSRLTLTDLEGAEAEILDKTLVEHPAGLPETKPVPPPEYPPEITETTLSGYAYARDAIEKLFANTPPREEHRTRQAPSNMDVEATLSALEETLSGVQSPTLPAETPTDAGATAPAHLQEAPVVSSTVRFTREEVMAAMAEAATPGSPSEPTTSLRASDFAAEAQDTSQASARTLMTGPLAVPTPSAPDTELLRLKIGADLYPGLTLAQVVQWVEEGRVLETHLVARQFSENWIEAYKVPSLRPVFDRLRRERANAQPAFMEELPPSSIEAPPARRGLFGGLFGGKN